MIGAFTKLSSLAKVQYNKIRVDNLVFKLHYKFTMYFLLGASVLVTMTTWIGEPIQCIHTQGVGDPKQFGKALQTYCWIMSTFTLPHLLDKEVGTEVPHAGVGPHTDEHEKTYHAYYQWVPFVLFFQGLVFYVPHWIWKAVENKRLQNIVVGLNNPTLKADEAKSKVNTLAQYMLNNLGRHQMFVILFGFCELLNLIHILMEIKITDAFLGHEFSDFGIETIKFTQEDYENRTDPLSRVFPLVTKCTWHMFGRSGTIEKYDAICVLALNIINEKIYIFLWFWFVLLSLISGIQLIYRITTFLLPQVRVWLIRFSSKTMKPGVIESLVSRLKVGDWFILYHLKQFVDPINFEKVVIELEQMLSPEQPGLMKTNRGHSIDMVDDSSSVSGDFNRKSGKPVPTVKRHGSMRPLLGRFFSKHSSS
ncbi:unnamed protein product [Cyprideis torosa]|uniref:Innexin n=1 Tax=Cyprideis torosa TaxID=163714 RepID=A0A7R8WB25_9CRUS|nr:unnamed protein product [Cyprideis torosa]CAG0891795.1 unnamed protein product [Cyprideis torosa]